MVTVPLLLPQVVFVLVTTKAVGPGESITIALVVNVQPFASFTITVYVPAAKPV